MTPDNDALLLAELRRDEGVDRFAYEDSEGFLTIGVGFLVDRRKGGGLTDEEIDYLLGNRVKRALGGLDGAIPWWRNLDPVRRRVLSNMAYQLGTGGVLKFRKALAAIKAADWPTAKAEMLDSAWAKQTPERAERLAEMMLKGSA